MKAYFAAVAVGALALAGTSAASAADMRLPVTYRHAPHARYHVSACPVNLIDDRGYVVDWTAYHLRPPPRGYCWFHRGAELHLEAMATGYIIQSYQAF